MTKKQKLSVRMAIAFTTCFAIVPTANAMHIMEGFLPIQYCIAWGAICIPFLVAGFFSIRNKLREYRKGLIILAMVGAYAFVLSALKIPSVTGSSSHPTGTGLCAIIFGPCATAVIGMIVLLFQAILLAHGGLTTLGANIFSMAIAGPLVSFGIYKLGKKMHLNHLVTIFLAAAVGDLFTYCVTSIQLGLAHPGSVGVMQSIIKFMGIFAVTQIPLAIIEGIVTAIVVSTLEAYAKDELLELGFLNKRRGGVTV